MQHDDAAARVAPATTRRGDLTGWRTLIRERFVCLDIAPRDPDEIQGAVDTTRVGWLSVSRVRSAEQTFRRTHRLVSRDGSDLFQVGQLTRGAAEVSQDGRSCVIRPGQFVIYETGRPFTWRMIGDWELSVFTWPRGAIGLDAALGTRLTARTFTNAQAPVRVAGAALTALGAPRDTLRADSAARLAGHLADLVLTAALDDPADEPLDHASRRAADIRDYIEDNLADADLTPESIARALFLSTRTLHRLFARDGRTVAQWIRARRLDRARRELHGAVGKPIGVIAAEAGFTDAASFSRLFRAQYGLSPREYRMRRTGHAWR